MAIDESHPGQVMSGTPTALTRDLLDPRESAVLRRELPGLVAAFDEQRMREALQAALFHADRPRAALASCEVEQATYILDEGVILRYALTVRDGETGAEREALVSGRLFPSRPACDAYVRDRLAPCLEQMRGRAELALFDAPVGTIGELHMAIYAWPIDADLPALMAATDPVRLTPILNAALPALTGEPFTAASCRVELVDYGRQHRATLRYHLTGRAEQAETPRSLLVYGKLTADGSGAMAESISSALRQHVQAGTAGYTFRVPRALPWLPDIQLSLLEAIPGEALIADQLKNRLRNKPGIPGSAPLEEMIDACAHIAAALHTSGLALGPRRTLEDELAALRRRVQSVQRLAPAFGSQLAATLEAIARAAEHSAPLPLCFNHGDFTSGQILFDGAAVGLVDFDSVCQAEPALDLGQFLTYLRLAGLKSTLTAEATAAAIGGLTERFLDTYARAAGHPAGGQDRLRERIAAYQAVSLLRRSLRSWQKFKPDRIASALTMLEDAVAGLAHVA